MQRLTCPSAGEDSVGVMVRPGAHVVAVVDPGEEEFGERCGHWGGRLAEPQPDLLVLVDDVVDGKTDDSGTGLGIEKDDDRGDTAAQRQAVVGEELAEQVEALIPGKWCRPASWR